MFKRIHFATILILITMTCALASLFEFRNKVLESKLPLVAIASYGPHSSLDAAIRGTKDELRDLGFIEGQNIRYEISNASFDPALIPQVITTLKSHHPKVMVILNTPVAQFAKTAVHDIPIVCSVITDPVEAGLLKTSNQPEGNITVSSDRQDLTILLQFAKKLIPQAKRVGLLYATAESNDLALVKMMQAAAAKLHMEVIAIPVDQARDVHIRMQEFKGKADFIYVGSSGPIQPTLPTIAAEAKKMGIPVFNLNQEAVKEGIALASFGVDYDMVGRNAGKLAARLLNGEDIRKLTPLYPTQAEHHGFINKHVAEEFSINIPEGLKNVEIVN
ncbi:MAG: ABC transporter substrate-binding protein [Proteobacteria bacterium]|nr:ABC transporter substrate-binding protein [Pseudomonadota bacterium]